MDRNNQDQADLLRKQMDEINQHHPEEPASTSFFDPRTDDIDILNLPPRKAVHDERKTKTKWKISFAFVRFFAILLFILAILIFTYSYWGSYFLNEQIESKGSLTGQFEETTEIGLITDPLTETISIQAGNTHLFLPNQL